MTASFARLPTLGLGLALAACASVAESVHRARSAVGVAFVWALDLLLRTVARPALLLQDFIASPVAGGPALAYTGPPIHSLRHEAGTSRRAAARGV